jgi:hypothetical protein
MVAIRMDWLEPMRLLVMAGVTVMASALPESVQPPELTTLLYHVEITSAPGE